MKPLLPFSTIAILFTILSGILSASGQETGAKPARDQLHLRVEFFDLSADDALRIQQEVAIQPDQSEARTRILEMVESKKARFVSSAPLVCRIGSRGKFEDTEEVPVIKELTWNEEARELVPKFGSHPVGTIFEVDPGFATDGETLDLNFAIEHHTGPPETENLLIPAGDAEESREVTVTRFHRKKITTRIFLKPGAVALIGAFEITGKQDDDPTTTSAIENPKRLAFLCAEIPEYGDESR